MATLDLSDLINRVSSLTSTMPIPPKPKKLLLQSIRLMLKEVRRVEKILIQADKQLSKSLRGSKAAAR